MIRFFFVQKFIGHTHGWTFLMNFLLTSHFFCILIFFLLEGYFANFFCLAFRAHDFVFSLTWNWSGTLLQQISLWAFLITSRRCRMSVYSVISFKTLSIYSKTLSTYFLFVYNETIFLRNCIHKPIFPEYPHATIVQSCITVGLSLQDVQTLDVSWWNIQLAHYESPKQKSVWIHSQTNSQ